MKSFVFPHDHDVMRGYLAGDYEPAVTNAIEEHVRDGTRCLNVGANVGYFAFLMHCLGGEVVAVEPDPDNVRCLRVNCPDVRIIEVAASDQLDVDATMFRDWQNSGNSSLYSIGRDIFKVMAAPLERLLGWTPEFAVFDCQGHDHLALRGCGHHLPLVAVVEHWPQGIEMSGWTPDDVLRLYKELGYGVQEIDHMNLLLTRG